MTIRDIETRNYLLKLDIMVVYKLNIMVVHEWFLSLKDSTAFVLYWIIFCMSCTFYFAQVRKNMYYSMISCIS